MQVCSLPLKVVTLAHFFSDTKEKQCPGFYPAHPKGRHLAPCDFVCKATPAPWAGAWQRTTAGTPGLSPTKRSTVAVPETLVYLFSYSLLNQYQKQQKCRREGRHTKTYAKANKCLFSRGRELERATISPSYLSLAALAPNECSPTLGHIPFVLYQFFWTAERYWASLITESIWISNQTWTPTHIFS